MAFVDAHQAELNNLLALQGRIYASGEEFSTSELRKRYPNMKAVNDRIDLLRMLIVRSKAFYGDMKSRLEKFFIGKTLTLAPTPSPCPVPWRISAGFTIPFR